MQHPSEMEPTVIATIGSSVCTSEWDDLDDLPP